MGIVNFADLQNIFHLAIEKVTNGSPAGLAEEPQTVSTLLNIVNGSNENVACIDGTVDLLCIIRKHCEFLILLIHLLASQVQGIVATSNMGGLQ